MKLKFHLALLAATLLSLTAHAEEEAVQNVAMLSLIGNNLTTEVFAGNTGTRFQDNRKFALPIDNPVFDVEAIQSANTVYKRLRPGVKTTLLVTQDAGLYQAQNELFDNVDGNKDNRTYLSSLLKNRAVTKLILITKYRSYAEFMLDNGKVGNGRIEGLGFYMDNETRLMNSRSLAMGNGFIAAYVYAKVRLIDADTLTVLKEVNVKESDLNGNFPLTGTHLAAWDALTSQQKVTRLNDVIKGSIAEAIPKLLQP